MLGNCERICIRQQGEETVMAFSNIRSPGASNEPFNWSQAGPLVPGASAERIPDPPEATQRLRASDTGRRYLDLFERHRNELIRLINRRRPVAVAWQRSGGGRVDPGHSACGAGADKIGEVRTVPVGGHPINSITGAADDLGDNLLREVVP
jgi:hypothetical protein